MTKSIQPASRPLCQRWQRPRSGRADARRRRRVVTEMAAGSYQVEASDEGLMTDDIEACLRPVLNALRKFDLPATEVRAWCAAMVKSDRVGFLRDQEFRALRRRFEKSRPR